MREWLAEPTHSAEVYITKLTRGDHYFVCSVSGHCSAGMRITIHVEEGVTKSGSDYTTSRVTHTIPWRIQDYQPLTISEVDSLYFTWNGYHSLHQVLPYAIGNNFLMFHFGLGPLYYTVDWSVS